MDRATPPRAPAAATAASAPARRVALAPPGGPSHALGRRAGSVAIALALTTAITINVFLAWQADLAIDGLQQRELEPARPAPPLEAAAPELLNARLRALQRERLLGLGAGAGLLAVASWLAAVLLTRAHRRLERTSRALQSAWAEAEAVQERFHLLMDGVRDYAICLLDPTGLVVSWNAGAERLHGFPAEAITGQSAALLYSGDDLGRRQLAGHLEEATRTGRCEMEGWRARQDGACFWANVVLTALRDGAGQVRGFAQITRDVTEQRRAQEQLTHLALHDALTGLPNRTLYHDRLRQALARRARLWQVAALFLDLDDFKRVNDSLGHHAGDCLLTAVAERLSSSVRPGDTVARLGDDEFAIVLEGVASRAAALAIAERIAAEFEAPFAILGQEVLVGVSIGVACADAFGVAADELLGDADIAMFGAKRGGKRRVALFEPAMRQAIVSRLALETDLRRALDAEELALVFQPIIALGSGQVVAVEALARWRHPARGPVPPEQFVALAEERGLIVPLGRWVLTQACAAARRWRAWLGPAAPLVSVNLSAGHFQAAAVDRDAVAALDEADLPPAGLMLEITESVLMHDAGRTAAALRALKEVGVSLAIDDFGVGYSSLSYLRLFPIDFLKIDRSFGQQIEHDPDHLALLRAIVAVGRALRLRIVLEGLERAEQVRLAHDLGCDLGQGYVLARPLPEAALTALLVERAAPRPAGTSAA